MRRTFWHSARLPGWLLCGAGLYAAPLFAPGCAAPALESKVRGLEKKVAELSMKNDESAHRQDDLENRVFLLSDQVESQKVAQARRGAPDLPVVALRPPPPVQAPLRPAVEFQGAAQSETPDKVRPLLRAEGNDLVEVLSPSVTRARPGRKAVTLKRDEPLPRQLDDDEPPGEAVATRDPAKVERRSLPQREGRAAQKKKALLAIPAVGDNLGVVPVPPVPVDAGGRAGAQKGASLASVTSGSAMASASPAGRAQLSGSLGSPPLHPEPRDEAQESSGSGDALVRAAKSERPKVEGEPLTLYRIAYDRLRAGHFAEAEQDLREFVRRFPRHDYADNAQYWLGETFYARKTYNEAAAAFRAVVERWPSGNKAPDALLKLGYSLLMMGDRDKGRGVLTQVVDHYPRTDAARLAERRLSELKESP
jgi:tol-pal system protein YbgF